MSRKTLAAMMVAAVATSANAHSKIEDTTPANAAVVTAVETIAIRFDDPMRVTAVFLTGPDGAVEVDRITGTDPVMEFLATPPADLPAGTYSVEWRGLSADGHPMQGGFEFAVAD